ncbi:hypothetical protein SH580_13075 [Coraliomargarita algicola]|uniref:Lipoprotein n=1 Tax=Coraliomargarita algicola TaxID=3092156 RepID=A0ABZ0RG35_9BACT|nr:hypothetical protein [Coraliomargarita sp. J2-16]WPJ94366.1 hypothetical protein SH580_13075 [Coraliomargarita sp. J2-16]
MKLFTTRSLAATTLLLALSGCERDEPTSYLIPKEERSVSMPGATAPAASSQAPTMPTQAPTTAPGGMQVLPGMQEAANQAGEIRYTVPEGWEELAPSGIRKANLKVTDANGSAELTVLVFPGDVGGRLANINRWRGQIGLEASTPDDLPAFTEGYQISQHRGLYVRLVGEQQSILGGLLPFHGNTWFFKFLGDNSTVLANESNMKAFLDSVQIQDTHH